MERVDEATKFQRRAIRLAKQMRHPALGQMQAFLTQLQQSRKG
jgi:hypothetical protein